MNSSINGTEHLKLDQLVGRRPMSRACRATDSTTGADVLIKAVCYPTWLSASERHRHHSRTLAQLQLMAEVQHPSIPLARLDVVGSQRVTLVRDWVDGCSLAEITSNDRLLPANEIARIARQCSGAIDTLAEADLCHGALTARNLILCSDGSVMVTDTGFAAAVSQFDLAGVPCKFRYGCSAATDIAALAEALSNALNETDAGKDVDPAAARIAHALQRAQRDPKAFASAASLADALTTLTTIQIARRVWRPATAVGMLGSLVTVGTMAFPENRPISEEPAHVTAAISRPSIAPDPVMQTSHSPEAPKLSELSTDDRNWLTLAVRRFGVAALIRPQVAHAFALNDEQSAIIRDVLRSQRDIIAAMVEQAATKTTPSPTVVRTSRVRTQTTNRALAALTSAQRDLWFALAGQEPAQDEPLL